MNESKVNNRKEQFLNIAKTFLNASRGHGMRVYDFDNPVERLSSFALMLYLMKNNSLVKAINIPDSDDAVVLTISPSMVAGDMEDWLANNIGSKGLLKTKAIESKVVKSLYKKYQQALRTCNEPYSLFEAFDSIQAVNLTDDEYLELLEVAEKYMAQNNSQVMYTDPSTLGQLVSNVLSCNPKSVFDPFMGTASFATSFAKDVKFVGWDIKPSLVEYAQLKLAISGREYVCKATDSVETVCHEKYDAIVTFPPLGLRRSDGVDLIEYALRLFEDNTTESGEMAIVVNSGFCVNSGRHASLRKEFTEKNYLDDIIAIPSGYLYGTGVPCVVLHLRKNREKDEGIGIYNLGEGVIKLEHGRIDVDPNVDCLLYVKRRLHGGIQTDDIRRHNYSWSVLNYPDKHSLEGYHGGSYKPFSEVVKRICPEACDSHMDALLNIRKVESHFSKLETYSAKSGRCVIVKEPVLVVGYKASCPLVAIEASETHPAYLSEHEIIYRCPNNVYPMYLANLVANNHLEQKYFEVGSLIDTNRSINTWLQGLDMCIVPPAEQHVIVEDAYRAHLKKQAEDAHMLEYIEQIKEQYTQEVRSRKHNMRPYLREMKSSNDLAQLILKKASSIEEVQDKLLPLLLKMEQNRKGLSEIVDHLSQVDKYGEPEIVEIDKILDERFRYYEKLTDAEITYHSQIYSIGYNQTTGKFFRLEKPEPGHFVSICPYDLRRMVDCIIDNARVHGFEGHDAGHHIEIDLSYNEEEEMVEIRFTNDGKPFPEGFDINRYGLLGEKAGPHAGTGDGGHQVVGIAKHYHGYVTLESTKAEDPKPRVSIIVHLPAYPQEEWDNDQQGRVDLIEGLSIVKN